MRDQVIELVRRDLQALNEELGYESLNNVTEETPIFSGDSGLDSLSLVTLIVGLEGRIDSEFNQKILLADERAMSSRNSPFRTVGSLADFIVQRLQNGDA